jgi:hypothetical protein
MKIGVIIPSRLAPRPGGRELRDFGPELWLDGAMASVVNQRGYNVHDWEIFVGVDPGAVVPIHVYDHATVVRGQSAGQASGANEAAEVALLDGCDVLAFLEDDDRWHRRKSEIMLPHLEEAPFLSCTQRLIHDNGPVGEEAVVLGVNDYPTPSGWVLAASLWKRLGGFSTSFKWMPDMELLGRVNDLKVPRLHFKERGLPRVGKLNHVALHATIVETDVPECLVSRTVNSHGGIAMIERGGVPAAEATAEVAAIREKFGDCPW